MNRLKRAASAAACLALACACLPIPAKAEHVGVWQYHTHATYDHAYSETLQAVSIVKFTIQQANKDQGTIYGLRACWVGSCNYGSVLVIFTKEKDGVDIKATFTERSISLAPGPRSWGKALGKELKKDFPDLTIERVKR